ncbi:MAG: proline--tRNA ligase, partial [Anaerolineales bacterium]
QFCWTTSWGVSTRMVGAVVMAHGDDTGLRLPPRIAPIQVVMVPIYKTEGERGPVMEALARVKAELTEAGLRVHVDDRPNLTPGFKYNDWEMRGVPVRLEIGPKDVQKESVALARRDIPGKAGKQFVPQAGIAQAVQDLLDEMHASLLQDATEFRDANITEVGDDYAKFQAVLKTGWALAWFCGDPACEATIKADNQAVSRCFPLEQPYPSQKGACIKCGRQADEMAYFARAY